MTTTQYMELVLPAITTTTVLGTLPQDWALILNGDFTTIDIHDHGDIGNPIPSTALNVPSQVNVQGVNILTLSSLQLSYTGITPTGTPPALYTDGTDLWYLNGSAVPVQITASGVLNPANTPGPFYGSTAAASLSGTTKTYTFLATGAPSTPTATLAMAGLTFNQTQSLSLTTLTMPNNFALTAIDITLILVSTPDFPLRSIVTNSATYEFSNVVGDGSLYSSSRHNVPIVDPNGIYHFTPQESAAFVSQQTNPNMNWHQGPSGTTSLQNSFIQMFCSNSFLTLQTADLIYMPGEVKSYTISHYFPELALIPFWNGVYSMNMCKWVFSTPTPFYPGYNYLEVNISQITYISTPPAAPVFVVTGTITNTQSIAVNVPANSQLSAFLRVAAIFPKFNSGGVFFDSQY